MNRHDAYNKERKEMEEYLGYAIPVSVVPEMLRLAGKSLREISGGIE